MNTLSREKFSSQASPDVLAALRQLAASQGRQFQAVLDAPCAIIWSVSKDSSLASM